MADTQSDTVQGSALSSQLGQPPAYLADGQTAYKATIVASWPAHNQARFRALLYTGEQLERAVAAERERYSDLMLAVEWLLDDGHMHQEHLARLRAAWEGPNARLTGRAGLPANSG